MKALKDIPISKIYPGMKVDCKTADEATKGIQEVIAAGNHRIQKRDVVMFRHVESGELHSAWHTQLADYFFKE